LSETINTTKNDGYDIKQNICSPDARARAVLTEIGHQGPYETQAGGIAGVGPMTGRFPRRCADRSSSREDQSHARRSDSRETWSHQVVWTREPWTVPPEWISPL